MRVRERIPSVSVASQEEALSTGKARGTPWSCHHFKRPQISQSIPEDLVFTECLNFHAEDRLTPRWHGGQPCGKASWEIL